MQQAKRPVSSVLAGPYGHPFHPILVTVPIGAWVASLVFDLASLVVSHPGFLVQGSRWLIGLGVLGALAAGSVGFLDLLTLPAGTKTWRTGIWHMSLNLGLIVVYALNFLWRGAQTDSSGPVGPGPIVLSVVTLVVLGVSGFLGGKLAFRYGVRVADEQTQAEGYLNASSQTATKEQPWQ
jgi:uncharacterized membrane protein